MLCSNLSHALPVINGTDHLFLTDSHSSVHLIHLLHLTLAICPVQIAGRSSYDPAGVKAASDFNAKLGKTAAESGHRKFLTLSVHSLSGS